VCRNKKINWIVTQEHKKLYKLHIIEYTPTTKKHPNHGQRPPWPLSPSVAVFCQFRRNASTHYSVGGALIARFLFFHEGGWVLSLFIPVIVEAIFFWHRRRLPPPLPLPIATCRPFWGDACVKYTICGAAHAQFAKICAVGAALGVETLPIEKKSEGRKFATPATAFVGIHGSFSPVPVYRACLPHCRRRLARMFFFNLRRGVSSIVFLIDEF
jgi:hypothetical protein